MWLLIHNLIALSLLLSYAKQALAFPQNNPPVKAPGCWSSLPPLPGGPRQEHGVGVIGSSLYVIGGMKHGGNIPSGATTSVEVYNTETKKWSKAAPLPRALHHPNAATVDGKMYILGGVLAVNTSWQSVENCYRYDPSMDKWEELTPMAVGTGRGSAAVGVYGKSIYLAGGFIVPKLGDERISVANVSSYDTSSGKWTLLPMFESGEGRDHGGGAVINSTFYVVGGRVGGRDKLRGTVFAMDLSSANPTWLSKASMPTPRGGIGVAAVENKIYASGGEGNAKDPNGVFSNTESYNVLTDAWSAEIDMATPRHGMQAVALGGNVYFPGGGTKEGFGGDLDILDSFRPGAAC